MTEPTTVVIIRGTRYRLTRDQLAQRFEARTITLDELTEAEARLDAAPPAPRPGPARGAEPLTAMKIKAMPRAEQRKLATERWDETATALKGGRPPGPLTKQELAALPDTMKRHPELAADPDRWTEIQAEMTRRAGTTGGSK